MTYAACSVKGTVDYIIVQHEDKAKVRNVKVIPSEECLPECKLLVMDMQCNTTKRGHKKFEPRVCVWKLSWKRHEGNTKSMVRDKVEEAECKYLDVNEHWQHMNNIMMETADVTWIVKRSMQT